MNMGTQLKIFCLILTNFIVIRPLQAGCGSLTLEWAAICTDCDANHPQFIFLAETAKDALINPGFGKEIEVDPFANVISAIATRHQEILEESLTFITPYDLPKALRALQHLAGTKMNLISGFGGLELEKSTITGSDAKRVQHMLKTLTADYHASTSNSLAPSIRFQRLVSFESTIGKIFQLQGIPEASARAPYFRDGARRFEALSEDRSDF